MIPRDMSAPSDGEIAAKIEEIVYEVEAGQVSPWMASKRLMQLFRRRQIPNRGKEPRKDPIDKAAVS